METQHLLIDGIPAVLWGKESPHLFIALHGDQSHKMDDVIAIFSHEAVKKGYQVLSFDLPEHGDRKEDSRRCNPQNCIADIEAILRYGRSHGGSIGLFGCSIGAYFAMLACGEEDIRQALFLSPVTDMKAIIENIMGWFDVSLAQLEEEKEVVTPVKTLYWDYYQYVLAHPIKWNIPTAILYGEKDDICALETVQRFAEESHAHMTILEGGAHFFHTPEQLAFFKEWLKNRIE